MALKPEELVILRRCGFKREGRGETFFHSNFLESKQTISAFLEELKKINPEMNFDLRFSKEEIKQMIEVRNDSCEIMSKV